MSHDSGFRRGGRDVTYGKTRSSRGGGKAARRYEERKTKRFHDHEKTARPATEKDTPPEA